MRTCNGTVRILASIIFLLGMAAPVHAAGDSAQAREALRKGDEAAEGKDYKTALRWYRQAAETGNAEAQDDVGLFYLMGMGVKKDPAEGARWLRKAAAQGNPVAERNLGVMYLQGIGVPADREEGIRWLRKAAAHGDDESKAALKSLGVQ